MGGSREGGLKAAAKNRAKDPDFYTKIGEKGGKARINPYYHFRTLKEQSPDTLVAISQRGGKNKGKTNV